MVNSSGSIFIVHKAAAPKNGVEFRQGFIGDICSSLATSCEVKQRCDVKAVVQRELAQ